MFHRYHHTQRSPLHWLLYALAAVCLLLGGVDVPSPAHWILLGSGLFLLLLAASFQHLTVADEGDQLSIAFGPLPLFRRSVRYDEIKAVAAGRTTLLDGWGIHLSLKGGWVWNIWGRDCIVLTLRRGVLRIGTDDPAALLAFLKSVVQPSDGREPDAGGAADTALDEQDGR